MLLCYVCKVQTSLALIGVTAPARRHSESESSIILVKYSSLLRNKRKSNLVIGPSQEHCLGSSTWLASCWCKHAHTEGLGTVCVLLDKLTEM